MKSDTQIKIANTLNDMNVKPYFFSFSAFIYANKVNNGNEGR